MDKKKTQGTGIRRGITNRAVKLAAFAPPRLGVNIDHVATLRQLRGTPYPDILEAAHAVARGGGEQITVHLREDRRHIQDEDVRVLRKHSRLPLNLEMAVSDEMVRIAIKTRPEWVCLVPEKREELTTEGGLNLSKNTSKIAASILKIKKAKIKVSCFIEPSTESVRLSHLMGADAVEFHTGRFCMATQGAFGKSSNQVAKKELERLKTAAQMAQTLGVHSHAGHGFDYENVRPVVELEDTDHCPLIEEYNIGHAIVCRAAFIGLEAAVREMVSALSAP
jgi:pyridoxine 5-phosphate synthase